MKLLLIVGALAGGYCYVLLHTSDIAINQVMQLHQTYSYVGEHADEIAGARQ
ncbi:hypothetical protein BH09PAT4_BH09PAT4_01960 [soil metagenome]